MPPDEVSRMFGLANSAWGLFTDVHTIENRTVKELWLLGFMAGFEIGKRDAEKRASNAERPNTY